MRPLLLLLTTAVALAAGCNRVYVPEGIDPLPARSLAHAPSGSIAMYTDPDDAGLIRLRKRRWLDPEVWAAALISDLEQELQPYRAYNDPDAEVKVYLSLHHWSADRSTLLKRIWVTLTVYDLDGNIVHEQRYDEAGRGYDRALKGVMFRVKEGLLNDDEFLKLIRR